MRVKERNLGKERDKTLGKQTYKQANKQTNKQKTIMRVIFQKVNSMLSNFKQKTRMRLSKITVKMEKNISSPTNNYNN